MGRHGRHWSRRAREPDCSGSLRIWWSSTAFSGYEGTAVVPPGPIGEWRSLIRFRTEPQLSAWLVSPQRAEVLPPVRSSLTQDFSAFAQTTPLGTTVRTVNGKTQMTPSWKTAMLLLMVLYPMVMLQSKFVARLMPTVSSWCRRWLDPVDGAGLRISLRGAAVAATVDWLQYWK